MIDKRIKRIDYADNTILLIEAKNIVSSTNQVTIISINSDFDNSIELDDKYTFICSSEDINEKYMKEIIPFIQGFGYMDYRNGNYLLSVNDSYESLLKANGIKLKKFLILKKEK